MSKTILITGASTGIGFDAVRTLTENGFSVIATVRQEADKQKIEKHFSGKARALLLDVNDFAQVDRLPEILSRDFGVTQLDGLMNNAGVAMGGPFAYQNFDEIQSVIQTNVVAVMKVTHTLLPLLGVGHSVRREPARIVNISSVSGTSALPFLAVYAASKHAIEGWSKALRNELNLYHIPVVVIGPGSIKTEIWRKGFAGVKNQFDQTPYAESVKLFGRLVEDEIAHALPVSKVSECVVHAFTAREPKRRYDPIPRGFRNRYLQKLLPATFLDKMIRKLLKLHPA